MQLPRMWPCVLCSTCNDVIATWSVRVNAPNPAALQLLLGSQPLYPDDEMFDVPEGLDPHDLTGGWPAVAPSQLGSSSSLHLHSLAGA
jgi:hypothetical protein